MEGEAQVNQWIIFLDSLIKILVVAIPVICTYFVTKSNARAATYKETLEKQLTNVFAPIHKMYCFDYPKNKEEVYPKIDQIINQNIAIVPSALLELWAHKGSPLPEKLEMISVVAKIRNRMSTEYIMRYFEEHIHEFPCVFFELNKTYFEFAQQELGYARKKVNKKHKKIINQTLHSRRFFYHPGFLIIMICICSYFLVNLTVQFDEKKYILYDIPYVDGALTILSPPQVNILTYVLLSIIIVSIFFLILKIRKK